MSLTDDPMMLNCKYITLTPFFQIPTHSSKHTAKFLLKIYLVGSWPFTNDQKKETDEGKNITSVAKGKTGLYSVLRRKCVLAAHAITHYENCTFFTKCLTYVLNVYDILYD